MPRELLAFAHALGHQHERTAGGHIRFRHPAGALVFTASTPSDWRSTINARAATVRTGA
jgi:predicted RNA binding protein YcfA (HicA-like mRNA interferase family)